MLMIDLHCDTLTAANDAGKGLLNDDFGVSLNRLEDTDWCQCFAIYLSDDLRGEEGFLHFQRYARFFSAQMTNHITKVRQIRTTKDMLDAMEAGQVGAMLTVENGVCLGGDLKNIKEVARAGVRIFGLTWNAANDLAGGCATDEGLTFFGRMALGAIEQNGMIVDVSHCSVRSFWDVDKYAKRPFIATHSNAYGVCPHERNLTDNQFTAICKREGLVGLNYYVPFIVEGAKEGDDCSFEDLCAHIDHFRRLGGEQIIALGSDFDGGKGPSWLEGLQDIPAFRERLKERYGEEFTERLLWRNAFEFFKRYEALEALFDALGR